MQYRIETWNDGITLEDGTFQGNAKVIAYDEFTDTMTQGETPWDALYNLVMALGVDTKDVDDSWKGVDNAQ